MIYIIYICRYIYNQTSIYITFFVESFLFYVKSNLLIKHDLTMVDISENHQEQLPQQRSSVAMVSFHPRTSKGVRYIPHKLMRVWPFDVRNVPQQPIIRVPSWISLYCIIFCLMEPTHTKVGANPDTTKITCAKGTFFSMHGQKYCISPIIAHYFKVKTIKF